MQELPDVAFDLVENVVVDSDSAKKEVGDLINPITAGTLRESNVIHLAELVAGRRTLSVSGTTIFKSVGYGLVRPLRGPRSSMLPRLPANRGTSLTV